MQYNGLSNEPASKYKYKVNTSKMDVFFNTLVTKIKVQDWKDNYNVEVCDGWVWECKIRSSNNMIKKAVGTVEPPPGGEQLMKLIFELADFEVKPWIL